MQYVQGWQSGGQPEIILFLQKKSVFQWLTEYFLLSKI